MSKISSKEPNRVPGVLSTNLFRKYFDAQEQARFRASITGYRYRVVYDRFNGWWHISESVRRIKT